LTSQQHSEMKVTVSKLTSQVRQSHIIIAARHLIVKVCRKYWKVLKKGALVVAHNLKSLF